MIYDSKIISESNETQKNFSQTIKYFISLKHNWTYLAAFLNRVYAAFHHFCCSFEHKGFVRAAGKTTGRLSEVIDMRNSAAFCTAQYTQA